MVDGEELITGREDATFKVGEGSDKKDDPPQSTAEALLRAHPDLTVGRGRLGDVGITQDLPNRDTRNIHISVGRNRNSLDKLYPDVTIRGLYLPRYLAGEKEIRQFTYGLKTLLIIHTEPDEQVHVEVDYSSNHHLIPEDLRSCAIPIPTDELRSTATNGLEILKAYVYASKEERRKIDSSHNQRIEDGCRTNVVDDIAEAHPGFYRALNDRTNLLKNAGIHAFFALNALQKVTKEMLPKQEPPPLPGKPTVR
jgi:hypothetical protein